MKRKLFLFSLIGLAVSLIGLQTAQALTFALNYEYSGGTRPSGPAPWITATFDSIDGTNKFVRLTMDAHGLQDNEYISEWSFNLGKIGDDDFDQRAGLLNYVENDTTAVDFINYSSGQNHYKAGPDGYFDLRFGFPNGNNNGGANRFTAGEKVIVDLFFGLDPDNPQGDLFPYNFDFESEPGKDEHDNLDDKGPFFLSAAHIGAIGPEEEGSGWIAPAEVPESPTLLLVGLGLIGLAGFGRRRFKA